MTLRSVLFLPAVLLASGSFGQAATILVANLTNLQENPPTVPTTSTGAPRPASFGMAMFMLNDAMTAMTFSAAVFNIDVTGSQTPNDPNDNLTAAHIHAPAPPGMNTSVVWGFFGAPFNDNMPNDMTMMAFPTGMVGGMFTGKWDLPEGNGTNLTAQIPNILAGLAYINFHTTQFGGGEIRGQIQVVPEPSAVTLFGAGVFGLFLLGRRR